jgi:prevent-host-death family protein
MKKASIRDLHIHTSELVREAAGGMVITIERRGEPVAELRPLTKPKKKVEPPDDMAEFRASMPQVPGDSSRFLEEDR